MSGEHRDEFREVTGEHVANDQSRAHVWVTRGRALLAEGRRHEALDALAHAIRAAPDEPEAYNVRSSVYFGLGEMQKALADAERAVHLAPASPTGWAQRAYARARQAKYREAVIDYTEAIRLAATNERSDTVISANGRDPIPLTVIALYWRAHCYIALREYALALDDLEKVVTSHPRAPDGFKLRAWVYRATAAYESAVADATLAIRLNPDDPEAFILRSSVYCLQGNAARAMADCDKALQLAPGLPCAWTNRAYNYRMKRNFASAIEDYTEAIRLAAADIGAGRPRPTDYLGDEGEHLGVDITALIGRAACYAALTDYKRALGDFNKVIELNPLWPGGFARRARLYRKRRDFERAWGDCATALSLDPECSQALAVRGSLHSHYGRDIEAIADFTRSIEKAGGAYSYANRGLAYVRLKKFDRAIYDYTEAIRLLPQWGEAYEARGRAHFRVGDWRSAIEDFTRALEIKPDLERALQYRGFAREALGDYAGATRDRLRGEGLLTDDESASAANDDEKDSGQLKGTGPNGT
jgi:tetratricopeptide (TPR) repeat protein